MYFYAHVFLLISCCVEYLNKSLNEKGGIKTCAQFVSMIVWITIKHQTDTV